MRIEGLPSVDPDSASSSHHQTVRSGSKVNTVLDFGSLQVPVEGSVVAGSGSPTSVAADISLAPASISS